MEPMTDEEIREDLAFAFQVSQDNNAYTAEDAFWNIQANSAEQNLKDKECLHSMCPVISWQ